MTPQTTSTTQQTLRTLYQQLMTHNQDAFVAEQYDVAYHVLMAALHCVQTLEDRDSLGEIARVVEEQLRQIDQQHPEYIHSSSSSAKRGHGSIFSTLAHQARTRIQLLSIEARR